MAKYTPHKKLKKRTEDPATRDGANQEYQPKVNPIAADYSNIFFGGDREPVEFSADKVNVTENSKNKITCLLWNICGIRKQFRRGPVVGISRLIKELKPDIICLNELKAPENSVNNIAQEIGYGYYCVPSTFDNGKHARGSAIFCKDETITVKSEGKWSDANVELVWLKVEKRKVNCHIVCCYAAPSNTKQKKETKFKAIFEQLKGELPTKKNIIVVGDSNLNKSEHDFKKLCDACDYDEWVRSTVTNVQDGGETSIDIIATKKRGFVEATDIKGYGPRNRQRYHLAMHFSIQKKIASN